MADDLMIDEYSEYVRTHCKDVLTAFMWIAGNIPSMFEGMKYEDLFERISRHDASKWDDEEFYPYCENFYGEKSEEVKNNFNVAWWRHQKHNDHHWNYWVLVEDGGNIVPIEMPKECVIEMLCDHWSFSWEKNNLMEIFDYYEKNKDKMILHESTRKMYEEMLDTLRGVLEEKLYVNKE